MHNTKQLTKTRKAHENSFNDFDFVPEGFNVTFIPERIGTWVIDIDDCIRSVSQFASAIQALDRATEDDTIRINLQCDGGSLGATDAFIHAMRKCEAHIHVNATGGCHSSATLILLEAHSLELSAGFNALLHCGSLGTIGNLNEYKEKSVFDVKYMAKTLTDAYEGFLSEDEISRMLDGKDIWLDAAQWQARHELRSEYFKAKHSIATEIVEEDYVVDVIPVKQSVKKIK